MEDACPDGRMDGGGLENIMLFVYYVKREIKKGARLCSKRVVTIIKM